MRKESRAVLRTFSPILAKHVLELLAVAFALPTAVRLILIARPRRLAHWDAALASINFVAHALASS